MLWQHYAACFVKLQRWATVAFSQTQEGLEAWVMARHNLLHISKIVLDTSASSFLSSSSSSCSFSSSPPPSPISSGLRPSCACSNAVDRTNSVCRCFYRPTCLLLTQIQAAGTVVAAAAAGADALHSTINGIDTLKTFWFDVIIASEWRSYCEMGSGNLHTIANA